jgi:hypothetical protein
MSHVLGLEMMLANAIKGAMTKATASAKNADNDCIVVPRTPENAAMPATVAANIAPTPTGLMS